MTIENFRTGVEIEFNTGCSRDLLRRKLSASAADAWEIHGDGSIGTGWEIVSPVMAQADCTAQIQAACAVIHSIPGAHASERCGLHVHLSGWERLTAINFHVVRNIARAFVNFEDTFDLMQPENRRASMNNYCKSNREMFGADPVTATQRLWSAVESVHSVNGLVRLFNPRDDRYRKLNLTALHRHGTIEFRHHEGTIDADAIDSWVRFLHAFCNVRIEQQRLWKRPATTPETVADRFRKLTRRMPASLVTYARRRIRSFGGAV